MENFRSFFGVFILLDLRDRDMLVFRIFGQGIDIRHVSGLSHGKGQ
jgi:hypothetical protein